MAKAAKANSKPAKSMVAMADEIETNDPTGSIGNLVYEEWEGRIELKKKGKDSQGKDIYERKFVPLICRHKKRKITEAEALSLNISAQESSRLDYVVAYLPAGEAETGKKVVLVEPTEDGEGEE